MLSAQFGAGQLVGKVVGTRKYLHPAQITAEANGGVINGHTELFFGVLRLHPRPVQLINILLQGVTHTG